MVSYIRKHIFSDKLKSASAPQVFIILCFYTVFVSVYTGLFFGAYAMVIRALLSIALTVAYVIFERSPLKAAVTAFCSSVTIVAFLITGAIYFKGDFLLFTYTVGVAMILLTYLKPQILLAYIVAISIPIAFIVIILNVNLLGASFTMVYNILSFVTSAAMNILIYIFCKSYAQSIADLIEAKNAANIAAETKGKFLSTMSHEIRTPMNAIIGMANIGISTPEITSKHNALIKIEDASAHLLGIINDVLDMSKIEAGKLELSSVEFVFERALKRVINVMALRVDEKKQEFTIAIDGNIPEVLEGDDQRLVQVLTNLLGNAVKFTPDFGSICLDATLLSMEDRLCTIQFRITDSGIGISPEQQTGLFNSFQQADASTSRRFGGTGLGLTISKNIISMMGGTIWVESELGKGAAFIFTVQMKNSGMQKQELISKKASESTTNISQIICSECNILLVDDAEINREIVIALLEPTMIGIDCAEDGKKAVQMFTSAPEKYNMIFMDVHMPEMDGYDATRHIRALDVPCAKTVPIVAMTANVFKEDIEKCLEAGMDDHIGKPIDFDIVLKKINKHLSRNRV